MKYVQGLCGQLIVPVLVISSKPVQKPINKHGLHLKRKDIFKWLPNLKSSAYLAPTQSANVENVEEKLTLNVKVVSFQRNVLLAPDFLKRRKRKVKLILFTNTLLIITILYFLGSINHKLEKINEKVLETRPISYITTEYVVIQTVKEDFDIKQRR